jgi:hypothetical protein
VSWRIARDHLVPRGIVIIYKAARQSWRGILIARIAVQAGHARAAASARMRALPWSLAMEFADPAAILAKLALHRLNIDVILTSKTWQI